MFGGFGNRAAAYAKVGVETGVNTADPHKLILMLFDGALLQVRTAGIAMQSKDIPGKGMAVSKAVEIIINGLKVSLDLSAGGELAQRLAALYDYVFRGGPAPAADWKPSVPEPSEKEKDALRLHWAAVRRAEDFEA